MERLLLLGVDHTEYGSLAVTAQAGGRSVGGISVGGAYVRLRKGDLPVPNEDACVVLDDGERTLLAVFDGHHGHWASHGLAEAVAEAACPGDTMQLLRLLSDCAQEVPEDAAALPLGLLEARSTILLAVVDRHRGRVFGLSCGDSSLFVVTTRQPPARANRKDDRYVSPWLSPTLDPRRAREFLVEVKAGDLVVACSDGIDECHYHHPASSVGVEQLWSVRLEAGGDPEAFVRAIGEMALRGVGGHPGGQDNVVIAASRV